VQQYYGKNARASEKAEGNDAEKAFHFGDYPAAPRDSFSSLAGGDLAMMNQQKR